MELPFILGLTAALVHVLTGPDHLAAVTPLVFERNQKHWIVGLLWGIGHLIGMLLIGLLFYFFRSFIPIEAISNRSEQLVGLILILLGLWAFYRMYNKQKQHIHPHTHDSDEQSMIHIHKHSHHHTHHEHQHVANGKQQTFASLGIGIVHGFAGIAHFVLLLPVLGFDSNFESLQYIFGFGIGVVLAMMFYTFLIGMLDKKVPQTHQPTAFYKNLQFWSGVLAIGVGVFWIAKNWN